MEDLQSVEGPVGSLEGPLRASNRFTTEGSEEQFFYLTMNHRSSPKVAGLREARLRANLTQQCLAKLSGLQRQHVSALENYRLLLTNQRARKLAPHLGVDPAELVVGHAAAPILCGANRPSLTAVDFRALVRAFSAARARDVASPGLTLELIGVVRAMSEALFSVWRRLLDDAQRDAERALEAGPS